MDNFDERIRKRAEVEDCALPEGFEKRLSEELGTLDTERKPRVISILRYALIAAALCALLTVTAYASGIVRFEVEHGQAILGRFAYGIVFDENGLDYYGNSIAKNLESGASRVLVDQEGTTVLAPTQTDGAEICVVDGKLMLYYQCGNLVGELDISNDVRRDGGYHIYDAANGNKISIDVYKTEPDNGTEFEGAFYRIKGYGKYPPGFTGVSTFTFDVPNKAAGNCYIEVEPIND